MHFNIYLLTRIEPVIIYVYLGARLTCQNLLCLLYELLVTGLLMGSVIDDPRFFLSAIIDDARFFLSAIINDAPFLVV